MNVTPKVIEEINNIMQGYTSEARFTLDEYGESWDGRVFRLAERDGDVAYLVTDNGSLEVPA